jgi:tRNA U34 5-methylaminomethyl-2-thiouridine-forming methyltransferase MnmC
VIGVDEDVAAAQRRGLSAVQLKPLQLGAGALEPELAAMGALFDAAVFHSSGDSPLVGGWWGQESLGELGRVLKPGGKLCVQAPVADEGGVRRQLEQAGFTLLSWEPAAPGCVRLVASARQGS